MPDLGTKYECTSCGTKFHDMGRADAICPKCGLNPLTDEVEEIGEEQPAAESEEAADEPEPDEDESSEDEAPSDDDDDVVDIDPDEDENEGEDE